MKEFFLFSIGGKHEFIIALQMQFRIRKIQWHNLVIEENGFDLSFYSGPFSLLKCRGSFNNEENGIKLSGHLSPNYLRIAIPFFVVLITWLLDLLHSYLGWFHWLLIILISTAIVLISLIIATNQISSFLKIIENAAMQSSSLP